MCMLWVRVFSMSWYYLSLHFSGRFKLYNDHFLRNLHRNRRMNKVKSFSVHIAVEHEKQNVIDCRLALQCDKYPQCLEDFKAGNLSSPINFKGIFFLIFSKHHRNLLHTNTSTNQLKMFSLLHQKMKQCNYVFRYSY